MSNRDLKVGDVVTASIDGTGKMTTGEVSEVTDGWVFVDMDNGQYPAFHIDDSDLILVEDAAA